MTPINAEPTVSETVGRVEGSEQELPTSGLHRTSTPDEDSFGSAVLACWRRADFDTEQGIRSARALHALLDQPYVEPALWNAAQGIAWSFCAAVLSGDAGLRTRANKVVAEAMTIASEARQTLGRAA